MATVDKNFKVKNGLIVGNSTNLVNYTSASPSNPFIGQLWISASSLYAWSSASTWVLIGDGNTGGVGGSASGTPFNISNTLVARSASGTFSISAIDLDTTASPALSVGRIQWNPNFGTPEVGLVGGNVTTHIGQHVHAYVTNAEGSPLVKGDVVYLYGASGDRASVKKASNTSDITSSKTLGVAAEAIGTGQNGFVTVFGVVDTLNLSDYSPGDVLWLSSSAGKFTNIKPSAPQHLVFIGVVARANPGNGQLFVNVQNGYELEELHDVLVTSVQDGDLLSYTSASNLWQNTKSLIGDYSVNGSLVISASSSLDALRINQSGSGNALVVEDSTNPDSSPFVVDSLGNVGIGGNPYNSITSLTIWTEAIGSWANMRIGRSNNGNNPTNFDFMKSRGTLLSPSAVNANDQVSSFTFYGHDGSNYRTAAAIRIFIDSTAASGSMPGRLGFYTTASGSTNPTERIRINSLGNVGIGTTSITRMLTVAGTASFTGDISAPTFSGLLLGNAETASSINWLGITSTPITLSGYGITDGLRELDAASAYIRVTSSAAIVSGYIPVSASQSYLTRSDANIIYAPLASASLTGTPIAPTAASGTNTQQIATTAFVRTEVSNLIASAPATLDTLNELAAALGNDPNFATSTASAIGQRLLASTASTLYMSIGSTANHATSASSINWSLVTNRPSASPALNPQIGVNLTGDVTGAASATLTSLANGQITISTTVAPDSVALGTDTTGNYVSGITGGNGITVTGAAGEGWSPTVAINSSASVDWGNVSNKPDPVIGVSLSGNTTGAASVTLTDLTNGQISITTNTAHAGTASSIAGALVTGTVANATNSIHSNTASSIAGSLVTGIVNNALHSNTASSINASLLTGTTLPSSIVNSSLTSLGTLSNNLTLSQVNQFSPQLTIRNTSSLDSSGYLIFSKAPGASVSLIGMDLGTVMFSGPDINGAVKNSSYITVEAVSNSAASGVASNMYFYTGDSIGQPNLALTITSTKRVGIGSGTNPNTSLDVFGSASITGNISAQTFSGLLLGNAMTASSINSSLITGTTLPAAIVNSSLTGVGVLNDLTVSGSINIDSGSLYVNSVNNRVGMGTTTPNTGLEVVGGNSQIAARSTGETQQSIVSAIDVNYFAGPTFRGTYISQYGASATGTTVGISRTSLGMLAFQNTDNAVIYTNGNSPLIFATLSAERMRITNTGNIGIGTTNPNRTLSVIGTASFTGDISAPTFSGLLLGNAQTASSINWTGVTDKPDPIIGVNLTGEVTGAASATLTDLNNAQITINTSGGGRAKIPVYSSPPLPGDSGSAYFDSTALTLNINIAGTWLEVGSVPPFDAGNSSTASFDGIFNNGTASTTVFLQTYNAGNSTPVELLA